LWCCAPCAAAAALHQAELSAEERELFPLVADGSIVQWYPYGYTMFAGVRRLLFRTSAESVSEIPHAFVYRAPAASPAALGLDDTGAAVEVQVQHNDIKAAGGKDQGAKRCVVRAVPADKLVTA
jgi:hypothetical protein